MEIGRITMEMTRTIGFTCKVCGEEINRSFPVHRLEILNRIERAINIYEFVKHCKKEHPTTILPPTFKMIINTLKMIFLNK